MEFEPVLKRVFAGLVNGGGFVVSLTMQPLPLSISAEINKQGIDCKDSDGVFHEGKSM